MCNILQTTLKNTAEVLKACFHSVYCSTLTATIWQQAFSWVLQLQERKPLPRLVWRSRNSLSKTVKMIYKNIGLDLDGGPVWELPLQAGSTCYSAWWRHQMGTFSASLAVCGENPPVTGGSPHRGQWYGALMFSLICAWRNGWANNRDACDLRRHRAHYHVIVMDYALHTWHF